VCGLTPAVGLQCSVRVDDVIQTEVHKNLQCSGKVASLCFYLFYNKLLSCALYKCQFG